METYFIRMVEENNLARAMVSFIVEDLAVAGIPEFITMETYFIRMVEENNLARAMGILQYLSELGFSNLKPLGTNWRLTSP
ncbi:hypothetical protein WDU94_012584 [Cyamophila willieti]